MYKVSPSEARTDLYQKGLGSAHEWTFEGVDKLVSETKAKKQKAAEEEKKQRKEREDSAKSDVSSIDDIAIYAGHREDFAKKQQELRDFTYKNIDKLRSGDTEATMAFQDMLSGIKLNAELSKNFREQKEAISREVAKNPDLYTPESLDYLINSGRDENGNISYELDPSRIQRQINYADRVENQLMNYAGKAAKDTPYGKTFTLPEAEKLVEDDLYSSPALLAQAGRDFKKAQDAGRDLGAQNPVDYYKKVHAPKLTINDTKAGPSAGRGSGSSSSGAVNGVLSVNADGTKRFRFEYANKAGTDNPSLSIPDPRNNSKSLDVEPIDVNFPKSGPPTLTVKYKDGKKDKTMQLDYNSVKDIMSTKFKIDNVYDLLQGNPVKDVKVVKAAAVKYDPAQEAGISAVMKKNGISRDEAVSALKKAGKLK